MTRRSGAPKAVDPATSERLGRIRQRDTGPELALRALLRSAGIIGYRVRNYDLPGAPDVANRRRGWAVFVHGCYWHHHTGCYRATVPKNNARFWREKFANNRRRDAASVRRLRAMGFLVLIVWECDLLQNERRVEERIGRLIRSRHCRNTKYGRRGMPR